jgi:hypothetical protein
MNESTVNHETALTKVKETTAMNFKALNKIFSQFKAKNNALEKYWKKSYEVL